jgi:ssRNA-specific RNase YbeY (16S rRNA maturation enzyme)
MPISITSHRDPEPLDLAAFERLAEFVLDREDVPAHAELSLALVDVDEMTELNEGYRGVEGPRTCSPSSATIPVRSRATSPSPSGMW